MIDQACVDDHTTQIRVEFDRLDHAHIDILEPDPCFTGLESFGGLKPDRNQGALLLVGAVTQPDRRHDGDQWDQPYQGYGASFVDDRFGQFVTRWRVLRHGL